MQRSPRNTPVAVLVLMIGVAGANGETKAPKTLRSLGDRSDLLIGAAVGVENCFEQVPPCRPFEDDPPYGRTLAREYSLLIPENDMQFNRVHPEEDRWDWERADFLVRFAEDNGMQVHGHMLVWHAECCLPAWLTERNWSKQELTSILKDHIQTLVSRYRGRVHAWNVVNEALLCTDGVCEEGKGVELRKDNIWRAVGKDYVERAFHWAREADPTALLFYNDYEIEGFRDDQYYKEKSDGVYDFIKNLVRKGVPIDGVGLQMHLSVNGEFKENEAVPESVAANLARYADLGLQVRITEMDVAIYGKPTKARLRQQAKIYQDMMEVCLAAPNCTAFGMWGLTDKYSWLYEQGRDISAPLIFTEDYKKKPAYKKLQRALKKSPRARTARASAW